MTSASTEPQDPEQDVKMTIWEHLGELRSRLMRAALSVVLCTGVAWAFRQRILEWLLVPYEKAWVEHHMPGAPELQTLSPSDVFTGYLEIALLAGITASTPIIFYQLWAFISPGLYSKEKRYVLPFVFFSSSLFLAGIAFAYYVAFPFAYSYFFTLLGQVDDAGTVLTQRPTMEYYLDFATRVHLVCGAVFELPLVISFLAIAGVVTPQQLFRFSRWMVLIGFVIGAVATPGGDVTFQFVVSSAIVMLYMISVVVAFIVAPRKKADAPAPEPPPAKKKKKKKKAS